MVSMKDFLPKKQQLTQATDRSGKTTYFTIKQCQKSNKQYKFLNKIEGIQEVFKQGKTVFYSIQYKNVCLDASELFHVYTIN